MSLSIIDTITVLLICADKNRRSHLMEILNTIDHTLITVSNSTDALAKFETLRPGIVIVDADLNGEDGYLLVERLRESPTGKETPVLMAIPNNEAATLHAFAAGADECIFYESAAILLRRRIDTLLLLHNNKPESRNGHLHTDPRQHYIEVDDNRYKEYFRVANDAIMIVDLVTGRFLDVNRRALRWLGYTREELIGTPYEALLSPLEQVTDDKQVVEELSTRGHFIFEQGYRTKSGNIVPAEVSSRIFNFEGRKAVLNLARDIGKRKQLEHKEREQRQLADALRDSASTLTSTLQLDEVLDRVLDSIIRVIQGATTSVMLIDSDNPEQAWIKAHRGYDATDMKGRGVWHVNPWDIPNTSTLQWMVENQKPLCITDTDLFDGWLKQENIEIRSYVGAPIIVDNAVIGFINIDDSIPGHFNNLHGEHLMAFANQAGIAIQNAYLHQEVKEYAEELEARVEERTSQLRQANNKLKEQIIERQRAEEAMVEERNLLRTVIDNVPDNIYVKDLEGTHILVNKTLRKILRVMGFTDDIVGKTDYDYLSAEIADSYRQQDKQIIATGRPVINREEDWPPGSDTPQLHYLVTKVPLRDQNGDVVGIVGINRDVTALQAADKALGEERNLLRTLIDHIPNEIYAKNREGEIILANQALIKRIGYRAPNNEVIGSTYWDYVKDDYDRHVTTESERIDQSLLDGKEDINTSEIAINDDRRGKIWLQVIKVALRNNQGQAIGILTINRDITEEKRTEERIQHIITGASCLLWHATVDAVKDHFKWQIQISNDEAAQSFLPLHVPKGSTYVETWQASILKEDREIIKRQSEQAIRAGKGVHSQEFRCRRADGQIRWFRETIQIKPITAGRYNLVGVCTDITERREAEETLQRTNDLLEKRVHERTMRLSETNKMLLQQIGERNRAEIAEREQRILSEALIDTATALSETLDLNKVLDRILTYASRVVPPHRAAEIMMIEEGIYVRTLRNRRYTSSGIKTTENTQRHFLDSIPVLRHILSNGPIVIEDVTEYKDWISTEDFEWVRAYIGVPIYIDGKVAGFLNLTSDRLGQFSKSDIPRLIAFSNQAGIAIHNAQLFEAVQAHASTLQQRVAERTKELEYERAQLHAILNAMTDGVIYHDDMHKPQYINQALERLTDIETQQWLNADVWPKELTADSDSFDLLVHESMELVTKKGIWQGEIQLKRKNGELFDAQLVTTLVTDADGQIAGAVTVIRDVSAEKRLEKQKARFIATASHELRTPITNLKTRLYLIHRQPEKLHEHLEVMTSVTDRMRKLAEDLLDVSRFENGIIRLDMQEIDIQKMISSVVGTQQPEAEKKQITLTANLLETPLHVAIDESRMMQVLTNLVMNAINYTPEGGDVEVSVDAAPGGKSNKPGFAIINVRDTGIGIPKNMLLDVFKPFFRANDYSGGTGLGLSITREIVELHNGQISVESEVDKGTCFTLRLPLTRVPGVDNE